jgi:NAD-dependent SIR2 family protein deacetylase
MSETVFILGAGASKVAGGPLMRDFLDVAGFLRKEAGPEFEADFKLVFDGIAELRVAQSKARIDIDNVESVFAAFEIAALFGRLGDLDESATAKLAPAMRRLIARTLELRIRFPNNADGTAPPNPYAIFARLVADLRGGQTPTSVSLMTFNYDVALDYALHHACIAVDYCLQAEPLGEGGVELMKLHGSLNWARCSKCNQIDPWPLGPLSGTSFLTRMNQREWATLEFVGKLRGRNHCSEPCKPDPVIVPPTWSKTEHYREIDSVWKRAAKHLAEAETIVVIGYSLPPTDQFFRYLYALGTMSDTRLRRFIVCNPDVRPAIKTRFRRLLGQATRSRYEYWPYDFHNSLVSLRDGLRRP